MLTRPNNPPSPRQLYGNCGEYRVYLASGVTCPHCGAQLRPNAVRYLDQTGTAIICESCDRDILRVEQA